MSGRLQGRVALITGASGCIGSAVAKRFAEEGANVILAARDASKLGELCNEICSAGKEAMLAPIDLRDYESVDSLALSVKTKFGKLDILVSTAAILGDLKSLHECDVAMWRRVLDTNLCANWNLIRSFDQLLKVSEAGRVVFVTSEASKSLSSYSYFGPYAISKVALESMMQVYAAETKHSKICVNSVYPRQVNSKIYSGIFSGEQSTLPSPESITDKFVELSSEECCVTSQSYEL